MIKVDGKQALKVAWKCSTDAEWPFEAEVQFHESRRWRFDWCSRELMLAVEVEGVTHYGGAIGRHQSAKGYEGDAEKYNAALALGWRVLRYSQRMIKTDPVGVVEQILEVAALCRNPLAKN